MEEINMRDVSKILEDLVRINSSNPPGNEKKMVDFIVSFFHGYENMKIIDHDENRSSLLLEIPGETKEMIAILGHLDTVPANNPDKWNYKPFEPKIVDGKMYGRGTSDMKSGIACMICLADHFIHSKSKPKYTVRIMFTADEESSGTGIRSFVDSNYFEDVKFLLIAEPTDETLIIKEKGALWMKLRAYGKSSHGSTPQLGINAIEKLFELTEEIRSLVCTDETDELLGKSSFALNRINGGTKTNITADYCEAEIDIRTIPSLDHETILDGIQKRIQRMEEKQIGLKFELDIVNNRIPMMTAPSNSFITNVINIMSSYGYEHRVRGANFFTDGSLVLKKYDIPFLIYGPGLIHQCHVDNEYVPIESLERVLQVYTRFLMETI